MTISRLSSVPSCAKKTGPMKTTTHKIARKLLAAPDEPSPSMATLRAAHRTLQRLFAHGRRLSDRVPGSRIGSRQITTAICKWWPRFRWITTRRQLDLCLRPRK